MTPALDTAESIGLLMHYINIFVGTHSENELYTFCFTCFPLPASNTDTRIRDIICSLTNSTPMAWVGITW